jgi:hypothetical protein
MGGLSGEWHVTQYSHFFSTSKMTSSSAAGTASILPSSGSCFTVGFAVATGLGASVAVSAVLGAAGLGNADVGVLVATGLGASSAGAMAGTGLVTFTVAAVGFTTAIGFDMAAGLGAADDGALLETGLGAANDGVLVATGLGDTLAGAGAGAGARVATGLVTSRMLGFLLALLSALSESRGLFLYCSAIDVLGSSAGDCITGLGVGIKLQRKVCSNHIENQLLATCRENVETEGEIYYSRR